MSTFLLKIATPDGQAFEGQVKEAACRGIAGDLAILAGHCNFCTAVGNGKAYVTCEDGTRRYAACSGGMLIVLDGVCSILSATWKWEN